MTTTESPIMDLTDHQCHYPECDHNTLQRPTACVCLPRTLSVAESRDAMYRLGTTRWRLYQCADCHPNTNEDRAAEGDEQYETPYQIVCEDPNPANPEAGCPVQMCPRCGSYLSMCEFGVVRVTTEGVPRNAR